VATKNIFVRMLTSQRIVTNC